MNIGEGVYVRVNVLGKFWTNRHKKIIKTINDNDNDNDNDNE